MTIIIVEEVAVDLTPAHEIAVLVTGNNCGWGRNDASRDLGLAIVLSSLDPFQVGHAVHWPGFLRTVAA